MNNIYRPNQQSDYPKVSSTFAFPVVVAAAQLLSAAAIAFLFFESNNATGEDSLIILWAVVPAFVGVITLPLNLITGPYYFGSTVMIR